MKFQVILLVALLGFAAAQQQVLSPAGGNPAKGETILTSGSGATTPCTSPQGCGAPVQAAAAPTIQPVVENGKKMVPAIVEHSSSACECQHVDACGCPQAPTHVTPEIIDPEAGKCGQDPCHEKVFVQPALPEQGVAPEIKDQLIVASSSGCPCQQNGSSCACQETHVTPEIKEEPCACQSHPCECLSSNRF